MELTEFEKFRDWIPVRGYRHENKAFVDWCYLGKARLNEPYFDDSIAKRFREPFNLLFRHQTPIEFLGELNDFSAGLKPTGFIFHLSRCGSTLVSQMLAALPQNIVISEAAPVDFVVRSTNISDEDRIKWLRWMINALGQKRFGPEENFFIKFDSWNTLEINLIQRAFPDVPWIFMYRNPVEIIVSQIRQRGWFMIPGLFKEILPDLSFEDSIRMPPEEYCARVLAKVCQSALTPVINGEGLAINYSELPDAVSEKILKHFKLEPAENDREKMLAATKNDAKHSKMSFSSDIEKKKKDASAAAIRAAEEFVNPLYEEFERIRKSARKVRL
jgi:hypothetical protein